MKFFALLLLLSVMVLLGAADSDEERLTKCGHCLTQEKNIVCSKNKGSYFNTCELQCDNAEFLHFGKCNYNELLYMSEGKRQQK